MSRIRIFSFFFFLFSFFIPLPAQNIQFQGEKVEIKVDGDQVQVTGTYYLYNPVSFPISRTLYYPFVVNQQLHYPDSIHVSTSTVDHSLLFRPDANGIFLSIPFLPEQSIILTVFYSQKTLANQFEYILITTKEWNRSLQFANYIIQIPRDKEVTYLSLDYQEKKYQDNYQIYYISRSDFMPSENLKIVWKEQ